MENPETILQALAQLTNWGILTTDDHLTITGWNHWLEVNSGRPAADVIGRPLAEVFPDLEPRRLLSFFRQALDGRVVLLSQVLHRYLFAMPSTIEEADLAQMQQSVRIAPLIDGDRIAGTLTVIEDVTDRVVNDTELALRTRQQATLAALGQQALVGGDIAELSDRSAADVAAAIGVEFCGVWEAAAGGHDMFLRSGVGWRPGVVGAAKWPAALSGTGPPNNPVKLDEESRNLPPCLKEHGIVSGISVPIARDGRTFGIVGAYSCRERAFADEDVHVLQAIANVLGLAIERKRLEAELVGRVSQLAEADARKDEFLAMLAHELRNPLAPIRNSVRLLRLKAPTVEELNYARNVIERQLQNMTRLVDDLLDVSRITRGKVALQKETVDLASVVERALEVSRPLIDQRKHRLTLTIPREPILVFADSIRLAQVIANLLNNAAKYTEEQGRIDLIVERTEQEAVIRIVDTGVGIAPNMLSSVFDLFTQAQGSVSRSEGGLGIGLSLVRSLVQMHDGVVTAASVGLGHGCQFEVRLPIRQTGSVKAPASGPQPIAPEKIPPRRILVVDDNVDAADSLAMLLRVIGHDVRTAHDGPAALEAARASRPEVVLLDIGLPYMSGLEVARHLRNDFPVHEVVLVALTGYGQDEDRRRSEEAGFNGHLVKPVDFDALQALIAQIPSRGGNHLQVH